MRSICVYCGSSDAIDPEYLQAAYAMGATLARRGLNVVFGAGRTGMMGRLADGALEQGGNVFGIIPRNFFTPQLAHPALTRMEVVENLHLRKARMAELSDAFIALPGGFGTFEELFEILTWAQVGLHAKPIGLLNIKAYFNPLMDLVEHALQEGFIYAEHRLLLLQENSPEGLLDDMLSYQPPAGLERWVNRED